MLYVYQLNWENKDGERSYFWTAWISQADARQNDNWEVSSPAKMTITELTEYANQEWCLPSDEAGTEDLVSFDGIPAYGALFLNEGE